MEGEGGGARRVEGKTMREEEGKGRSEEAEKRGVE